MKRSNRWRGFAWSLLFGALALPSSLYCLGGKGLSDEEKSTVDSITLKELRKKKATDPVVLVHLGDSHIQAGHLSGVLRRELQKRFGSAGRGWVSPHRLYGSNQPLGYNVQATPSRWNYQLLTQQASLMDAVGASGMLVRPTRRDFDITLSLKGEERFDKVYIHRSIQAPSLRLSSSNGYSLNAAQEHTEIVVDTLQLDIPTSSLRLIPTQPTTMGRGDGYSGFVLENTQTGSGKLMYHEIGLNGAMMDQYATHAYVRSLSLLDPDIVLVSLGSNESSGRNFSKEAFSQSIDRLCSLLRSHCPKAHIVLSTPPPFYCTIRSKIGSKTVRQKGRKRKYRRVPVYRSSSEVNTQSGMATEAIRAYCKAQGLDCIDLYSLMGGSEGAAEWARQGLYGPDKIHFSIEGYERQGRLMLREVETIVEMIFEQRKNASK